MSSVGSSPSAAPREKSPSPLDLKRLDGEFKSLRAQFREFHKRISGVNPAEATQLRSEIAEMRQQFSSGMAHFNSVKAVQQEIASLKQQVLQEVSATKQQLAQDMNKIQKDLQDVRVLRQDLQTQQSAMKQAHASMQQDLQRVLRQADQESNVAKAVQKEVSKLGSQLDSRTQGDFGSLKMVVASTSQEFQILRKQIYDSGVLAPRREIVEESEDAPVPVGTIELGEDMFSARLLVKLGFIKARQDQIDGKASPSDNEMCLSSRSGYSDDARNLMLDEELDLPHFDDLVHGIMIPEVREFGVGYHKVTYGWLLVCVATMAAQMLIVYVIVKDSVRKEDTCFKIVPSAALRWTLHLSKGCAVFVAGVIMGKELMDTVNYWMVSELLEGGHSIETNVSAVLRIVSILGVAGANVLVYMCAQDPADVFMNMTALNFVGELGYFLLDVAKRGVFGRHISKTMTELNFQITLISEYPEWFKTVQTVTVLFSMLFSVAFAVCLTLVFEIPSCQPDGSPNGSIFSTFSIAR